MDWAIGAAGMPVLTDPLSEKPIDWAADLSPPANRSLINITRQCKAKNS
jgi:hypothetical protein